MPTTQEFVNFYEILPGIVETSDEQAIRDQIRLQRQIWNKRAAQADPTKREQAQKRVRDLGEAERVLLNPSKKAAFDREARQYRPQDTVSQVGGEQRNWLELAREYFDRGNFHAAYYAAREEISRNGANPEAWSIRANSSFNMGEFGNAGFEFREAISLKPDNPEFHFDYGDAFAQLGQLNDARGEYEAALRLEPGNPLYRTAVASIQLRQGEAQKALTVMEDVVKEYPNEKFFQYYLALAIEAVQLTKWSQLSNGGYMITSPAQIDLTRQMSGRALELKFDDEPLRNSLKENLMLADRAAQEKWFHSNNKMWYIVALIVGLVLIPQYGLGLLIVGGVVWAYWARHHMPVWKFNARNPKIVAQGV